MYALRRDALPTGPNPLAPLSDFVVKQTIHAQHGLYLVQVDAARSEGRFEHALGGLCGRFWLAGAVLVASERVVPFDVTLALKMLGIEVSR